MTANDIITLISSVGFPIVCCGVLFWFMYKVNKQHSEDMQRITETINENTQVLIKLAERLGEDIDV